MADIASRIRAEYPHLAWALDVPELRNLLLQMDTMTPQAFQAALYGSNYYRTHPESDRQFAALFGADPATASERVRASYQHINDLANQMGFDTHTAPAAGWLMDFTYSAIAHGWSEEQITDQLEMEFRRIHDPASRGIPPGTFATAMTQIAQLGAQYFAPVDQRTASDFASKVVAGEKTVADYENYFRDQAKQWFPHLASQLDKGQSMADLYAPIGQAISQYLELQPGAVDPTANRRWLAPLDFVDDQGNHRMMTQQETAKWARSQAEFRNTRQARDQVAELGDQIAKTFGRSA